MQSIGESLKDYSYRKPKVKTSIAIVKDIPSASEADAIIADCEDLIDDEKFKPFFYKRLYRIGKNRFIEAAEKARKYGRGKSRFFVHLLK